MHGDDQQQNHIFSYLSPEEQVRKDHPLRAIRTMVDKVLTQLSRRRGVCRVDWIFTMACAAYNLVRMRNLTAAVPAGVSPGRRLSSGSSG